MALRTDFGDPFLAFFSTTPSFPLTAPPRFVHNPPMNAKLPVCLALALLLAAPALTAEIRTFTSTDGKQIEAELLDVRNGKVRLRMNRKPYDVPLEKLSEEDQEFIKLWDLKRQGKDDEIYYSQVIFQDDFEKNGFGERWGHYKSESIVKGGVLIGKTVDINDHAGVDSIRFEEGRQDLEISVKFNFVGETAERFNVWMDDKDYKDSHAGHICSVTISPTSGSISDAKTGNFENSIYEKRKGGGTLDPETQELLQKKTTNFILDLKREKWHTLVIRTRGDEVVVWVNDYEVGKLKSEGLAHETKSLVSLTTNINDVHYDDFLIKAAKPGASKKAD